MTDTINPFKSCNGCRTEAARLGSYYSPDNAAQVLQGSERLQTGIYRQIRRYA